MCLLALWRCSPECAARRGPEEGQHGGVALFGLLNSALPLGFNFEALRHLSAGTGAIIAATNPLLVALVAPRLLGERLSPVRIVGLGLGFGGVIFVMIVRLGVGIDTPLGILLSIAQCPLARRRHLFL